MSLWQLWYVYGWEKLFRAKVEHKLVLTAKMASECSGSTAKEKVNTPKYIFSVHSSCCRVCSEIVDSDHSKNLLKILQYYRAIINCWNAFFGKTLPLSSDLSHLLCKPPAYRKYCKVSRNTLPSSEQLWICYALQKSRWSFAHVEARSAQKIILHFSFSCMTTRFLYTKCLYGRQRNSKH